MYGQPAGDRLGALEIDGDGQASVRAAFKLSYRLLDPDAARLFRLPGLVPGADVSGPAAAALARTTTAEARRLIDRLHAASLVERPGHDRHACHDLLRDEDVPTLVRDWRERLAARLARRRDGVRAARAASSPDAVRTVFRRPARRGVGTDRTRERQPVSTRVDSCHGRPSPGRGYGPENHGVGPVPDR